MSLIEKQKQSIDFFINHKNAKLEVIENVNILRYEVEIKGVVKPALALFVGKSTKPSSNYYYSTAERREEEINRVVEREREYLAEKLAKLEERKAFKPTTKAGDIFVSCWGYEQTQVDFYLCQEVKGKTGTFVAIGSTTVEGSQGHDCCDVVANPEVIIGKPFKKLIQKSGNGERIALKSYEYCHTWSGRPMYRSWGY